MHSFHTLNYKICIIAGFTALCEKYALNSKNGTDQLTKTLNGYMGALVQEIIVHDGDILKYAGNLY